jgi:hypothetical protein
MVRRNGADAMVSPRRRFPQPSFGCLPGQEKVKSEQVKGERQLKGGLQ